MLFLKNLKYAIKIIITVIVIYPFLSLISMDLVASPNQSLAILNESVPVEAIVLNESSTQELVYISSDYSILIFRRVTPQLADLSTGDVLYLPPGITKDQYLLGQIMNIIGKDDYQQGMIIYLTLCRENNPPSISGLVAQPDILEVGQQSRLTCYAADPDGDILFYSWYTNKGMIRGAGATVTWAASYQPGDYFVNCTVMDNRGGKDNRTVRIQVVNRLPFLTYQERELIRQFGWGGTRTIRWPDGYVEVYDSTNFSGMQEVLDEWNKVIGGKVIFYLSKDPQSPVKISYNYGLSRKNLCYHIDTHWHNYQLYAAEVQINPDSWLCGYPGNLYAAYLHSFSGVVGFDVWQGTTIERKDWQDFTQISEIMEHMIRVLYQVPPGYNLN